MSPFTLKPSDFDVWVSTRCHAIVEATSGFDYYEVLGIDEGASQEKIRTAYKNQAMRWHPDMVSAENKEVATERFKVISAAYDVLYDNTRRVTYDVARASALASNESMPGTTISLARAWEIFINVVISTCVHRFLLSNSSWANRIVWLVNTMGIAAVVSTAGEAGGVAVAAITASLLSCDGATSIYNDLNDAEKVAFSQAILIIAKNVM